MNCYDAAPEFVDEDNRRFRTTYIVSKEQMHNKHAVLLPEEIIRGKSVLDLGSCIGATGHWCLSNGATHYTGVEFQPEYAQTSERLLNKYHPGKFTIQQMAIEAWLKQPNKPTYDVVCMLGVIYAFVDYFSILKHVTDITKSTLVIESKYPLICKKNPNFCGVALIDEQTINLATENGSMVGRGTRMTPKGLEWLMKAFGFTSKEGVIKPEPIVTAPDNYNRPLELLGPTYSIRFLMRFTKTDVIAESISENLQSGSGKLMVWNPDAP